MREICGHCDGKGKCNCPQCVKEAKVELSRFDSRLVRCSVCQGKGYHFENVFAGPRMPRPQPLRMPGLTSMKLPRSF